MNKKDMKFQLTLVVGDWSDDGHGKTQTFTIRTNRSPASIMSAYDRGSKKLGFDLSVDVASDYEDYLLDEEKWAAFVKHGLTDDDIVVSDGFESTSAYALSLYPAKFADLYLFIVKLGEPEFQCVSMGNSDSIEIGGYGLFD